MRSEHIHLHGDTARETIDKAIEHLVQKAAADARIKAFEDCTQFWKGEIQKVIDFGAPGTAQMAKVKQLFGLTEREEAVE